MAHSPFSSRLANRATAIYLLLYGGSVSCNSNATVPQPMVITEASEVPSLPGDTQLLRGSTGGGRIQHSEPRGGAELDDPNRPDRGPTLSIEGQVLPPELVNRCNNFDLSGLAMGASCGEPLSSPCFDFGRCGGASPTIYVYDTKCTLADSDTIPVNGEGHSRWREAAREAGLLAQTYESACLFIMLDRPHQTPCAVNSPLWKFGANHLLVDFGDRSRERKPGFANSFAMEAGSSQHTCYYRTGYDISLPLWPRVLFHDLQAHSPDSRKYLITFKGTLYVGHHGFEERASILQLHDPANDVVVVEKCWDHPKFYQAQEHHDYCAEVAKPYDSFDYEDLMDSTFALVCGGASPGTYRLGEVMSAGSIPVFVARDFVRPFREQIDWPSFSFIFTPDQVPRMIETLRAVPPDQLREMQRKSIEAYREMFGTMSNHAGIAQMGIKVLGQRLRYH